MNNDNNLNNNVQSTNTGIDNLEQLNVSMENNSVIEPVTNNANLYQQVETPQIEVVEELPQITNIEKPINPTFEKETQQEILQVENMGQPTQIIQEQNLINNEVPVQNISQNNLEPVNPVMSGTNSAPIQDVNINMNQNISNTMGVEPIINNTDQILKTNMETQVSGKDDTIKVNQIQGDGKNKNNKIIIVAIILAIVVSLLGVVGFIVFKQLNNPKTTFVTSMNKYLENSNVNDIPNIYNILSKGSNIKIDGNVSVTVSGDKLFDGEINLNLIDNPTNKQQYYNLKVDHENEQVIDLEGIIKDNKMYVNLKDIFDKFYYIEDIEYIELFNNNIDVLKENVITTLNTYFTEDKFVKSDATVNGENVKKITISMSDKDMNELMTLIYENLLKDDNALNVFVTDDMTLEDVKEELQDEIDYMKSNYELEDTELIYVYDMYLDGKTIIKQELKLDDILIILDGNESGSISISVDDIVYVTGTYSKGNISLVYKNNNTTDNIDITYNETITNNKLDGNYTIYLKETSYDDTIEFNTSFQLTIDNNNTIPTLSLNNAKSFDDMTEEESNNIVNGIMEIPYIKSLIEDYNERVFNATSDNYTDSYDYDYDYDYYYDYETEYDDTSLYSYNTSL